VAIGLPEVSQINRSRSVARQPEVHTGSICSVSRHGGNLSHVIVDKIYRRPEVPNALARATRATLEPPTSSSLPASKPSP